VQQMPKRLFVKPDATTPAHAAAARSISDVAWAGDRVRLDSENISV